MKTFWRYFLRGIVTLLPFGLTLYVLFVFLTWTESIASRAITWFLGDYYLPGMGLVLGISLICLLGFAVSRKSMGQVFLFVEVPFKNVPIIKSIYSAIKNLADYFSGEGENSAQVVVVRFPNFDIEMIGFLTRPSLSSMPKEFSQEDRVGVYFPMSYQIGGYTLFVPKAWVKKTDLPVEVAMRSALTAWMPGRN